MAVEIKFASIDDLYPYPENPRIDPVENYNEAIRALFSGREDKMFALASHIVENGLNPSELMIVVEEQGSRIVYEGNRRLAALKAIRQPSIISWDTSLSSKFNSISIVANDRLYTVPYISLQQSDALKWMAVRHLGEQSGIGISSWGHQESQRFLELMGQPKAVGMQIWEYYVNRSGDTSLQPNSFTTFTRLVASKPGQEFLNIKILGKKFKLLSGIDDAGLVNRITLLLSKMIEKKATSRTLNNVDSIQEFIDSIQAEPHFSPPEQIPLIGTNNAPTRKLAGTVIEENDPILERNPSNRNSALVEGLQGCPPRRHPVTRTFKPQMPRSIQSDALVLNRRYSDQELSALGLKGCNILHDLQALNIMAHPYSAAATARMILEYVAKIWANDFGITFTETSTGLPTLVSNIRQQLISKKVLNAHEQSTMKNLVDSQIGIINGYIHTPNINIQHQQLRDFWAGVSVFVEKYIVLHPSEASGQTQ